ncbi:MAG: BatA domain-containing protein [Chthoniobacteraceae bacterium]
MNWLFPGFLAGGFMIGLPVVLHFLRSKPKTLIRFPSLRFLGESAIRDTRKHRLRRWLTLALRTLIIALLAAAFARPFWKNAQLSGHTVMLVAVDNSMSMQAAGRWEQSRKWALAQLDELKPGDQAGLLLMNPTPTWLAAISDDLPQVRAILQNAQPGFETTRYANALEMAGGTLASHPAHTKILVWMADEQRLGWLGTPFDRKLPAGVQIRYGDTFPGPKSQAAITSAHWVSGPGVTAIEADIRLFSPDKQTRHIIVESGGKTLAEQDVELLRDTANKIEIPLKIPPDSQVDSIRISMDPDDLPADDTLWVAGGLRVASPILFTPPGDSVDYMTHALVSTQKLTEGGLHVEPYPAGDWTSASVAIVTGACFDAPQVAQLDRFAAGGGVLWIFVDGSPSQARWLKNHGVETTGHTGEDTPWHLRDWDSEHPILVAYANDSLLPLMDIEFYSGSNLAGDNIVPVANWPDGKAAIAEWSFGGRRMFLCGFPLDRSATNWFVQPSFVPFVHQAALWLAASANARSNWHVGDTIPLPAPVGTWRVVDSPRPAPERKVAGSIRPDVPGLYEFSDGKNRQLYAVNVPPEESDLSSWPNRDQLAALESKETSQPGEAPARVKVTVSDEITESQQRIWWWLLAACCAGMLAELALANRTAI